MSRSAELIRFRNVTIIRGSHHLAENLSLTINPNEKITVRGPSGAGKTSLLLAIVGVVPIESGTITINKTPLTPDSATELRRTIAFIEQEPVLGADVESVRDALLMPFRFRANRNHHPTDAQIKSALANVSLEESILSKSCAVISGGEKQRIAIARALLLNKKIILADEPTSALDDESRDAVLNVLADPDLTTIVVSHDSRWIRQAHRTLTLADGQLSESPNGFADSVFSPSPFSPPSIAEQPEP